MTDNVLDLIKNKPKEDPVLLSPLPLLYYNMKVKMTNINFPYDEVVNQDITNLLYETIKEDLKAGLIPKILIRGHVGLGKSAVALTLMNIANEVLETKYKKEIDRYDCIASDMQEFLRKVNKGITEQCIIIDEFSQLGESGLNSTTDKNWFITYQDLFAQKNIIPISCTPRGGSIYELGVNIILDVIGRNEKTEKTMCKLWYNDVSDGSRLLLGKVNIYVGDILKKDWYRKYRVKKFARMDLLDKHGVPDIRVLERSVITLRVFEGLKEYAQESGRDSLPRELILARTKSELQDEKLVYSMLGESEISNDALVLLGLLAKISKDKIKMLKTPSETREERAVKKTIDVMEKELNKHINRHKSNAKVLEAYNNIK